MHARGLGFAGSANFRGLASKFGPNTQRKPVFYVLHRRFKEIS
jgi:hypothetical protein